MMLCLLFSCFEVFHSYLQIKQPHALSEHTKSPTLGSSKYAESHSYSANASCYNNSATKFSNRKMPIWSSFILIVNKIEKFQDKIRNVMSYGIAFIGNLLLQNT